MYVNKLWAPWRYEYIKTAGRKKGCFFCSYAGKPRADRKNLVLYRGKTMFCVMNKFPYSVGHLMVAPYKHVPRPSRLSGIEKQELMELISVSADVLGKALNSEGFNLGANIGRVAGAGVPGHFHFHVVPRWRGDTNFMPILSGTKVMVTSLNNTYRTLADHFKKLAAT